MGSGAMSIFKRSFKRSGQPSAESKSRLEHQLYLARECPDPVFDLSACELSEVPKGVLSLCRVLQKETLLIHTNNLSFLKGGGNFSDLSALRILDLHDNQLKALPDEIGVLQNLQILNVERNQLQSLPESIASLSALQTLNLKGNQLKIIPDCLCRLCSLRFLDISDNFITRLPRTLCHVQTLEMITLDAARMVYPSAAVCAQGTEAIMKKLCQDSGIGYIPPSMVLLNVLPTPVTPTSTPVNRLCSNSSLENTVMQYENLKDKKRKERLVLEKQLEDDQRQQSLLAANSAASKSHLLQFMAHEHARLNQELVVAHKRKEVEKEKLFQMLTEAERSAGELVTKLLEMNEKARKTEELLEQMERERIEVEQWYFVRQGELENIRRKDVLSSMEEILRDNELLAERVNKYLNSQDDHARKSVSLYQDTDEQVESILNAKGKRQKVLVDRLLTEESLQKEMFEVLQCQKDARHRRITSQIRLIEQELAELTLLEIEQRSVKLDIQMNVLAEKRKALTLLLLQLMDEQSRRKQELRARLVEMEERRLANQTDYWLVQYQRLLDSKPLSLIDQEKHVEFEVIKILDASGASEYLPQFARNRISIETLVQMTDSDLAKIGVHEMGLRRAILQRVEEVCKCKTVQKEEQRTASQDSARLSNVEAEGAPAEVTARGINSECVICLNAKSAVLFLNCGHVCCCAPCAEKLKQCPLDRCDIIRRIQLAADDADFTVTI